MPKSHRNDWDFVGIAVNIIVATLLLGGLIMYAAAIPMPSPSTAGSTGPAMEDVDKSGVSLEAPQHEEPNRIEFDDDDDDEDNDEDEDDEDRGKGHGKDRGRGHDKDD